MLRELVDLAGRLEEQELLPPLGYDSPSTTYRVKWIVELGSAGQPKIREADLGEEPYPDRQRSGKPSATNLKPYLLVDQARYALGVPEEDKEEEAELLHGGFVDLVGEAAEATGDAALAQVHAALTEGIDPAICEDIEPRDVVTFTVDGGPPLYKLEDVNAFWVDYIEREFTSGRDGQCSVCGESRSLLRTLPQTVSLMGQRPQISSFNDSAFRSYGLPQSLNARLCYPCGARAAQALNHLTKTSDHKLRISDGQLAVFWTTGGSVETEDGGQVDLQDLLAASLQGDVNTEDGEQRPSLTQIRELVKVPWTARSASTDIGDAVHLVVLSPNKSRLVIREWIHESPGALREHLLRFLDGQRVQDPFGGDPQSFGLRQLLDPLEAQVIDTEQKRIKTRSEVEPNLVRSLLRTAYKGAPTPPQLESRLVQKLLNPKVWQLPWLTHRAIAMLTLARNTRSGTAHGTNGDRSMPAQATTQTLDQDDPSPAYRCGRLLAVLEEAQRKALGYDLNTTIVDRNFTAAATAPATTLPRLIHLAETAHLPKIRKQSGSDGWIRQDIEDILETVDTFPNTLDTRGQGDFILGFYHQRGHIRRAKREHLEKAQQEETEEK